MKMKANLKSDQPANRARERGASLLTVFLICAVLTFSVAGYLALVLQQSRLSMRSQVWNLAIAVSEAGVEEGLQQLNNNSGSLGADGWSANGTAYSLTRTLTAGNSYTVTIDVSNPSHPTVTSRAFIDGSRFAQNGPSVFLAAQGVTLPGNETGNAGLITRAVRVTTSRSSLFLAAMVAKKGVDLKGNGIETDSFDSSHPGKSTNGHYDPAKAGDMGDVASNDGIVGVVSVQNANVFGHVHTGYGGTASIGSQGYVGPHADYAAGKKGIQPGWATDDANFTFPDTTAPYSSGILPGPDDVVTPTGSTTNTAFVNNSLSYPTNTSGTMSFSTVATNTATVTSSSYPGATAGLTTNTVFTSTAAYPGPIPGLVTNVSGFTTVGAYPGPRYGLKTNYNASGKKITGYTYPSSYTYTYPTLAYSYPATTYSYTATEVTPVFATNHYDNVLRSGDYAADSLSGTTYVAGQARLVLPNGLSMSGSDQFIIGPAGSLTVYAGGNSITIGGNGVMNPSGFAGNFIVYCAPSVKSFTLNGNGEFTGVLVAPDADVTMNGGGNSDQDFIGALMVNSVRMNGHFKFHYDEALSRMQANGRYLITSWDEIK